MIRRLFVALAIAVSFPLSAYAATSASVSQTNCSGSLSSSLLDAATFSCTGSFSLSGGTIFSDSRIEISADGSLWLDDLSITAPVVQFASFGGELRIGQGVTVNVGSLILDGGDWTSLFPATYRNGVIVVSGSPESGLVPGPGNIGVVTGGDVTLLPGGDISLASPVPEPDIYVAMLLGLIIIVVAIGKRERNAVYPVARDR